jgi:hypothetical protein
MPSLCILHCFGICVNKINDYHAAKICSINFISFVLCSVLLFANSFQEAFYTPYREVTAHGTKHTFSATGHIEERLKTLRKREPPQAKKYPPRKIIALSDAFDTASNESEG